MKGYKGFDHSLSCRDHQYEVGKTYQHNGDVSLCNSGFHFCENPLDVFDYYSPGGSRFAEVEADGVAVETGDDSKRVCSKITVCAEIGLAGIISAGIKFLFDRVDFSGAKESSTGDRAGAQATGYRAGAQATGNRAGAQATGYRAGAQATGDRAGAQATGDRAGAQATGDRAGAQATGDRAGAQATGKWAVATAVGDESTAAIIGDENGTEGCAMALGIAGKAKGDVGCWLTLAEWTQDNGVWHRTDVQTRRVDGEQIKAGTFYRLKNDEFVETE